MFILKAKLFIYVFSVPKISHKFKLDNVSL